MPSRSIPSRHTSLQVSVQAFVIPVSGWNTLGMSARSRLQLASIPTPTSPSRATRTLHNAAPRAILSPSFEIALGAGSGTKV